MCHVLYLSGVGPEGVLYYLVKHSGPSAANSDLVQRDDVWGESKTLSSGEPFRRRIKPPCGQIPEGPGGLSPAGPEEASHHKFSGSENRSSVNSRRSGERTPSPR